MAQEKDENKKDAANFSGNPEKSFAAGKRGSTEETKAGNPSPSFSREESVKSGMDRGPGSDMYPSSQNLSESGKKEDQPRGNDPTKSKNKSEEGKGWAIDGRDHIET